jgi:hypothetical protein
MAHNETERNGTSEYLVKLLYRKWNINSERTNELLLPIDAKHRPTTLSRPLLEICASFRDLRGK